MWRQEPMYHVLLDVRKSEMGIREPQIMTQIVVLSSMTVEGS